MEPFGIDESWLDVTGTLHLFGGDPKALADRLRAEMKAELGLTISVGVSFNKVFAKLGSDYKKPDATTVITRENFRDIVWPLPVTDLLFVGRASGDLLAAHGIHTIGQLAAANREGLVKLLGKNGGQLHDYAAGEDTSPVRPAGEQPPPKSVGNGLTFRRDLSGREEIEAGVRLLAERVAFRLRKHAMKATVVHIAVRSPSLKTVSRQKTLTVPTNLYRELAAHAIDLLGGFWRWEAPVRSLTVTAGGLLPEGEAAEQLDLFVPQSPQRRDRQEKLERTMDQLRARYGKGMVGYAGRRAGTDRILTGTEEKEETP